jgi:hypothetical protein
MISAAGAITGKVARRPPRETVEWNRGRHEGVSTKEEGRRKAGDKRRKWKTTAKQTTTCKLAKCQGLDTVR